jgi:hypothetical protein
MVVCRVTLAGGVGLVYFNSTPAAAGVLRAMLRHHQQQQQHLAYPSGRDAHGARNLSAAMTARPLSLRESLQHTLLMVRVYWF